MKQSKNKQAENLIISISKGDTKALGTLYELIKTDVYAYSLSKLRNKADAEDVTEDTFVKIYKYSSYYNSCGKPLAWVFTIASNLIKRHYEVSSRSVGLEVVENKSGTSFEDAVCNNAFLQQVLSLLTQEESEIISLRLVSGLKHREIAKLINKPLSYVLSKYNRAVKKLKKEVDL
ncbi:MAG TPA: RNA polymerase sigma factor [Clostridiales bacterium]|nr:RNA polymerase sigma factor [Clostridiales bacterium]